MATDHDFKIKNGAQIENGFLLIGKEALSGSDAYMGMKTSNMTGTNDYMIISGTGDNNTYISAKDGASVYIRGGGNASGHQLAISSAGASFNGNLTVAGNFTVNGTTTTLNTTTLNVEDKNIVLNYGTGNTLSTANGSGITIQDAMAENHDATILWDTSNDRFNFSDPVNVDITGPNNTPSNDALTVSGFGIIGNRSPNVYITNSNSSGGVQIGVGGAHNANPKLTVSSSTSTFTVPVTINNSLSGDNSQLVINNTAGATLRMGITGSGANEAAHIKTNSGEALEFHIGQASNASTPDITFKADGAGIQIQGQDFVNSSRNITAGTISSGAITSSGNIGAISGHVSGKFAVKSTGVHASYDFYNNGTSYFNGTTEVNAEFKISSSSSYITHFNYQDNGVNIISQANGGSTSIRNNNGNLFTLSSTGSLSVAGNVIAGNSSTSAIVRAHYNDGSYMTLEGYGLVMNRGASYIRPSTDGDKYLYIGGADASLDWNAIHFRSVNGLYMTGTQFLTSSRALTNIAGITSSGTHTFTANDVDFIVQDTTDSITNYIWRDHSGSMLYLGTQDAVVNLRSALQINGTTRIDMSGNATLGTISSGSITSTGLTVDYTGHRTGDAGILVTNDASDWGIKILKDGTTDYGMLVQTDGANAFMVRNKAGAQKALISGSTGNATFAGTISLGTTTVIDSDAFRGRDYIRHKNSGNVVMTMNHDTYTMLRNPLGETRVWLGSTGYSGASNDNSNYYNGSTHFFRSPSSSELARINASGVDAKVGGFLINGTSVINSSRNIHNVGTISNTGTHSSSIGSNATYSRPLLEITSSATPTQIKITTNILYSGTGASTHAHSVRISGFQYGSAQMADLQIGWHVYQNQFYNRTVVSSGSWAPTVTLAVENNKVVIHLASPGYWPKLYVESMYNAYGGAGQAAGWSWADAAISADANTPNQTVPYKFDYGNGVLNSAGTTVIDSSRNLTNIGTISSGAITSTGNVEGASLETNHTITFGYNSHYLQAGTGSLFFKNSSNASLGGIDASGFNTPYNYQIAGTTVIDSNSNLTNIGTISSGAITSTGTSTFNNFRLTDASRMGFGTVKAGATVGHTASVDEGIFWHTGNDYGIYRTSGSWSSPNYQQLKLRWVTGIQLDGGTAYGKSGVDLINNTVLKINGNAVTNSSGQWTGGLNPSSLDVTHSSADSILRIAHGAANNYDAVIQLSGSAADMATEGAEIWYDNGVGDVHIATTYVHDDAAIRFHTRTGASKSTSNERLTIAGHGTVGINKSTGLVSSYKLHMGGHIHMDNNHIHYINQAHFNNGTRFLGSSASTTVLRSASSTDSNWIAFQSGSSATTRGYVGGNADSGHSVGLLDQGGNWGVRHINDQGTAFYADGGTEQALIGSDLVSGDYGGMVVKSAKGGWAGYSINNRAVFMHDNANATGIYNDVDNEWFAQFQRNGSSYIYTNGHATLQTLTSGIQVNSSSGESTSQIRMYTNGTIRGYVYVNTSNDVGFLDAGGNWAIRHIQNSGTEFRQGNTVHAAIGADLVSGSFGSMVVNETKSGWLGYSLNNRVVLMHDNANTAGLYNDVNNHWLVKTANGGEVELYHNGSQKFQTTGSGVNVTGNITHDGLTMTSGTDIDQLYTVTDSLTLTTSYQDTSINGGELSTGTYILQLYIAADHTVGGSHYNEFYSGVISWYGGATNSSEVDEIVLHRAGHAPNSSVITLRTQRHPSGGDNLVLQIKANYTMTAARNYVFKFRRMI